MISTFGVMFTPNQQVAASELIRVCKHGGKIGLANWTPDGFIGQLFKSIGQYIKPSVGVSSPAVWGTSEFLQNRFAAHSTNIQMNIRKFTFRYPSPQHWLDIFRTYYGPTLKAFEALEEQQQQALQKDILELIKHFNRAQDCTMVVPSDYAEIVIDRR